MPFQNLPIRLSPDATVRLILTLVMGLVLAVMVLFSSQQSGLQNMVEEPSGSPREQIVIELEAGYGAGPSV